MSSRFGCLLLALLALAPPASAQTRARAHDACIDRLHRDTADLPAASRQTRATLIANPGRIEVVAARAARASQRERAEIELGIARAAEWLKCVDPYGYRAIDDFLRTHPSDPVVADINRALGAEASANPGANGAANQGAAAVANSPAPQVAAAPAFNAPAFAAAARVVSPSH